MKNEGGEVWGSGERGGNDNRENWSKIRIIEKSGAEIGDRSTY